MHRPCQAAGGKEFLFKGINLLRQFKISQAFSIDRMVEETLAVYSQAIGIHFAGRRDR